jgi:cytochrome P450 StaP
LTAFQLDENRVLANIERNTLPRYNPSREFSADPYPEYAQYREHDPVHWGLPHDPRLPGLWYLFSHPDCWRLFRLGMEADAPIGGMPSKLGWEFGANAPAAAQDYFAIRQRFLTAQDPPDHSRVRGVISAFFTPKHMEQLRPAIERMVSGLFDEMEDMGSQPFDFIEMLGYPLPLLVVSQLMGVPLEDRDLVHELSAGLGQGFDIDGNFDRVLIAADAARRFRDYLTPVFDDHRSHVRDDVIGGMVAAADAGDTLDDLDLFATVSILVQGGQSTTMALLGRGLLALLQQPDAFARLVADPDGLAIPATEELLRFTAPAQKPPPRWVYDDVEIGGQLIRRGEAIQPMVGSANRDAAVFDEPDRLDLTRKPNPHLGFGGGVHRCVGSTLARLQGQIVFREIAKRMPDLQLHPSGEIAYLERHAVRALTRLVVVRP